MNIKISTCTRLLCTWYLSPKKNVTVRNAHSTQCNEVFCIEVTEKYEKIVSLKNILCTLAVLLPNVVIFSDSVQEMVYYIHP